MMQPEGSSNSSNLVCKLHKALYGLKQDPRACFERLATALLKFGFSSRKCDPFPFVHTHGSISTYVLVCVNDIIAIEASAEFIQTLITKLNSEFALKDLATFTTFWVLKFNVYMMVPCCSHNRNISEICWSSVRWTRQRPFPLPWFQV